MTTTDTDCGVIDGTGTASGQSRAAAVRAVAIRLQALEKMDYATLRREWRRLYRADSPKRVARDLLVLGVAWKIQEQAFGGHSAVTKRRLDNLAKTLERDGDVTRNRIARLRPGAKLVREWHGKPHTVTVVEDGFEWNGKRWRSLSMIAREITGVHWSGPRFFGLNGRARQPGANSEEPTDA